MRHRLSVIETDSFDRELFDEFAEESRWLRVLIERGSKLVPHFRHLMQDFFALFFKMNVLFHPEEECLASTRMGRHVLEEALKSEEYARLREETVLDGFKSAMAAGVVASGFLEWLKSSGEVTERGLLRQWELAEKEEKAAELTREMETWEEMERDMAQGEDAVEEAEGEEDAFGKAKREREGELRRVLGELEELEGEQDERMERLEVKLQQVSRRLVGQAAERVDEAESDLAQWGASMGMGADTAPPAEKLDLAHRLAENEKLKKLSRLVGSLKEELLKARRKEWSRMGSELYEVTLGNDLGYLIPSELVALRRAVLKREFFRKYFEHGLLQCRLQEPAGDGPVVVCLDGSSSMAGDKEVWAKALCIAFAHFAKRQRRGFAVIVFSSRGDEPRVFATPPSRRGGGLTDDQIVALADYFPGGGTDFETPLERAVELLGEGPFRRADVLFITDGECDVGASWLEGFLERKRRMGFKVYSVLIDLTGRESAEVLKGFSDKVTTVSELRSDAARRIFVEF